VGTKDVKKEISSLIEKESQEVFRNLIQEGEDLYERKDLREEVLPVIVFRLSREWYGVEMTKIKEILKKPRITFLPSAPRYIVGIMNLRGNILSVTDLKKVLGFPQEESSEGTRIIAVESGLLETGFLVDEVVESLEMPVSKIKPVPPSTSPERGKYLEGLFRWGNRLVALISVEKILEKEI